MSAGGRTIIDELFVKLGFVADYAGLDSFKSKAEEASSQVLKYGAAVGAVLGTMAVHAVAKIGDEFEQNTIALAGFFDALKISTGGFDNALKDAGTTLDQIIKDAALLPGEAEEYIEVFRAGLPVLKDAIPNEPLEKITDFTNKLTAIAHTLKVPVEVASREMQELFIKGEGHATRINVLFKRFVPFLRQVEGQANLTTKSFNALSAEKRVEIFRKSFEKLGPMLNRSATSFDAMKGAVLSGFRQLVRKGTEPMFEGMKRGLAGITSVFATADGKLSDTGNKIVEVGLKISGMVTRAVTSVMALVEWFAKSDTAMTVLKVTVGTLALAMAGLAFEKVARGVGLLVYSLMDLRRILTGALFVAIGLVAEDLYTFYTGGESVTGMIVAKLGPAGVWLAKVVLGGLVLALAAVRFAFVRTALAAAASWAITLWPLTLLAAGIAGVILIVGYLEKHWNEWGEGAHAAVIGVITVVSLLTGILLAFKAAALLAAAQTAIGFLLMASPVYIVIAALVAAGATIYLLWRNWDTVVGFMRERWMTFAALLINVPVFGPVLAAIIGIGTHFDDLVERMKAAWNSFAETMNATGVITLPTFKAKPEMLPAGDGVRMPGQEAAGPTEGAWRSPYASRGALPAAGTAEGPSYNPTGLADGGKKGMLDRLKGLFPGVDMQSMLGGLGGLQPAAYGGATSAPPQAMFDMLGGKGGGDTKIDQHFSFGDLKFTGDPMKPADVERFAQQVAERVKEASSAKAQRVIRNSRSSEEF